MQALDDRLSVIDDICHDSTTGQMQPVLFILSSLGYNDNTPHLSDDIDITQADGCLA